MNGIKRFFYYWRMPLIFFILFFVLLWLGSDLEGNAGGIISALWLFVDIPCLIIFTIRSIYLSIRDAINYHRTGVRKEDITFPEIDFVCGIIDDIVYEIDSLRELSARMRLRYFGLRLLSIVLIVGGIVGCFVCVNSIFMLVIFSLVIIAGATVWIIANPITYNYRVENVRTIPCRRKLTSEQLYDALLPLPTSLGAPRFADVQGFKEPVIVYGSASGPYIYVVYPARFADLFYVSTQFSGALNEELSDDVSYEDSSETDCEDFDETAYENANEADGEDIDETAYENANEADGEDFDEDDCEDDDEDIFDGYDETSTLNEIASVVEEAISNIS